VRLPSFAEKDYSPEVAFFLNAFLSFFLELETSTLVPLLDWVQIKFVRRYGCEAPIGSAAP